MQMHSGLGGAYMDMPLNHKVFLAQFDTIRRIAAQEPCIIVGRCADYVLRERKDVVRVFVHADANVRAKHVAERNGITESEAFSLISKTDRRRANYYNFYTGKRWGETNNYDLCIDSGNIGIENTAKLIAAYAKMI